MLIQLVSKKLSKGKSPEVIADELETEPETIQKICEAVQKYGADVEQILAVMLER